MRTYSLEGWHTWRGFTRAPHDLFYRAYTLGFCTVYVYAGSLLERVANLRDALEMLREGK